MKRPASTKRTGGSRVFRDRVCPVPGCDKGWAMTGGGKVGFMESSADSHVYAHWRKYHAAHHPYGPETDPRRLSARCLGCWDIVRKGGKPNPMCHYCNGKGTWWSPQLNQAVPCDCTERALLVIRGVKYGPKTPLIRSYR